MPLASFEPLASFQPELRRRLGLSALYGSNLIYQLPVVPDEQFIVIGVEEMFGRIGGLIIKINYFSILIIN